MANLPSLSELPGGDLIEQGLADLQAGVVSVESLLVEIGAPRLLRLGFAIPPGAGADELPEHRLYHLLAQAGEDSAHGRYNALIRRLVSFTRAASTCGPTPTPPA